jgi:hypothetical protein
MPSRLRTLLPLAALVLLCLDAAHAQQQPANRKRARAVRQGMTPAQVTALLGPPTRVSTDGPRTVLHFGDDRVVIRDCRVTDASLSGSERYYLPEPLPAGGIPSADECRVAAGGETVDTRAPERPQVTPPDRPRDASPSIPAPRPPLPPAPPQQAYAGPPATVTTLAPGDTTAPCPPPSRMADTVPTVATAAADVPPEEWRRRLRLDAPAERLVALPAASIANPTAFGVDFRQGYVGLSYQARTRFTDIDDAAALAGIGLGDRNRFVGVELTLHSYSTIRGGGPFETGGVGVKVHRALGTRSGVAAGVENAFSWGGSDAGRSGYVVGTHVLFRTDQSSTTLNALALSLGVGNGRFRSEDDVAADKEGVNVFGSAGLQLLEPAALVLDWTGQDLWAGLSVTPIRHQPLVVNLAFADLTRSAGDGPRFVASVAYGFVIPLPNR